MNSLIDSNKKLSKVTNFNQVNNFVQILVEFHIPFIFISIEKLIIENTDSHTLANPKIEKLIDFMLLNGLIKHIIFMSSKENSHYLRVYNQIASLVRCEGWCLKMNSNNFLYDIEEHLWDFKNYNKLWVIYIDTDLQKNRDFLKYFYEIFDNISSFHIDEQTFIQNLLSYFY